MNYDLMLFLCLLKLLSIMEFFVLYPECVLVCIQSDSSVFLCVPWIDMWSVMYAFSDNIHFCMLSFDSCENTNMVKLQFSTSSMLPF